MLTYKECEKLFTARARKAGGKKLAGNTWLREGMYEDDRSFAVDLYKTTVVRFFENGIVRLDSGGYRTVTTKDRLNTYSPVKVFAESGSWRVGWYDSDGVARECRFEDGMCFRVAVDGSIAHL